MPVRPSARPFPVILGVGVGLLGLASALAAARTSLPGAPSGTVLASDLAVGWSFAGIGVLLWLRYPESRIGALTVLVGLASFMADVRWFGSSLAWTLGAVLVDAHLVLLAWVLLAFPSGRLERRERTAVSAIVGYYLLLAIAGHLFEEPVPGCAECPDSLLLIRLDPALSDRIWGVGQIVNLAFVGVLVWLVVRKWRVASSAARRGLAPVMWTLWPIGAVLAVAFLEPVLGYSATAGRAVLVAERLTLVAFPIALGVGMLRSRLDQARVGDLARHLESMVGSSELEKAIGEALGDPTVTLGFWADPGGLIDVQGRPFELEDDRLRVSITSGEGDPIGVVLCDPAVEPSLVEAVSATASLALRNESLRAELRRKLIEVEESRGRISEAAVAERRRIERNLHDGAQQSLLALGASLGSIRAKSDGAVEEMLGEAVDELRSIIDELRELARGVHPAILTERGLGPALEALAERSAVPVSLNVTGQRCRSSTEAAGYFFVAEALANATRHAGAEQVEVAVAVTNGELRVRVADDGSGGVKTGSGTGITGLQDRLAALGGALTIHSPPGGGTVLEGVIPCD